MHTEGRQGMEASEEDAHRGKTRNGRQKVSEECTQREGMEA